jgi:hypothetical protein
MARSIRLRHSPPAIRAVLRMTSLYLHLGPFSRYVVNALELSTQLLR